MVLGESILIKIEKLIEVLSFLDSISSVFIVDEKDNIIELKNKNNFDSEVVLNILNSINSDNFSLYFEKLENLDISVALYSVNQSYGVVRILGIFEENITSESLSIFKLVATVISDVFENLRIFDEINTKIEELSSIIKYYKISSKSFDEEFFLAYLLNEIVEEIGSEVGCIVIFGIDGNELLSFELGIPKNFAFELSEKLGISSPMILGFEKLKNLGLDLSRYGFINQLLVFPIFYKGNLIAMILLANKKERLSFVSFSDKDIQLLEDLSSSVAVNIQNYRLYKEIYTISQLNKLILSSVNTLIVMTDLAYSVRYLNKPESMELFKRILELFDLARLKENISQNFTSITKQLLIGDKYYDVIVSPVFDEKGKVSAFVWSINDITYLKEEQKRILMTEKINIMSQIISGIAHEIKNPLTSIKGFVELLSIKKDDPKFIEKFVSVVSRETDRMIKLIESFMKFSKPVSYNFEKINIKDVILEALEIQQYEISKKKIQVTNLVENMEIFGSYDLLLQVFVNIILNSIQAIESDGFIEIRSEVKKNYVIISIKDNGKGIDQKDIEKVFEPFFTTKDKGTGLGLPISQRIVSEHGGHLSISSEKGVGTTVFVYLPLENSGEWNTEYSSYNYSENL